MVFGDDFHARTGEHLAATLEERRVRAQSLDRSGVVRHEDHRPSAAAEVSDASEALLDEGLVADCQYLIEDQDVRFDMHRDCKAQAGEHARRECLDRLIRETFDFREREDRVDLAFDLAFRDAVYGAREVDVLHGVELRVETRTELQQGAQTTTRLTSSLAWPEDASEDLQQRALAASVTPDDAERLARLDLEMHVSKSPEVLYRMILVTEHTAAQRFPTSCGDREAPAEVYGAHLPRLKAHSSTASFSSCRRRNQMPSRLSAGPTTAQYASSGQPGTAPWSAVARIDSMYGVTGLP